MHSSPIFFCFILACLVLHTSAENELSCNSCGEECLDACGTRYFRTCCFNYLRKRSPPPQPPSMYDESRENPWISHNQIEKMIHNAILRQENYNALDQQRQQGKHKAGYTDTTASPPLKLAVGNGRDQVHVIYDI